MQVMWDRLFIITVLGLSRSHGRPSGTTTPVIELLSEDPDIVLNQMKIESDIQFRYARTKIFAYYKNPSVEKSQQAKFRIKLPNEAFISNLSMILNNDDEYVAQIKEKEEANEVYQEAVSSGSTAALISATFKESQREFTVESTVEASGKVRFLITYEELLPRTRSYYEHKIHLDTKNFIIPDFTISVNINESLPITHLDVPVILDQSNLIDDAKGSSFLEENEEAVVQRNVDGDASKAKVSLRISPDYQALSPLDGARFVVRYDVDRKEENDVQVIDGYFVHFVVPESSGNTLPKYVAFVLDVSGSMQGEKIDQMKDAMISIIDELGPEDRFNILTFSDDVWNWSPPAPKDSKEKSDTLSFPATDFYKEEALKFILTLISLAGTNMNKGMLEGLSLACNISVNEEISYGTAKMLLFLTDGQATSGETNSKNIVANVVNSNEDEVLIYGLAFGSQADFDLIKTVSTSNGGFARRIHAGADAALQLENFFSEISSPIFSNLKVEYVGNSTQNVTEPIVRTFFKNQEMIVVGKIKEPESQTLSFSLRGDNIDQELDQRFTICLREGQSSVHPYISLPFDCPTPIPPIQPKKSPSQNFIERLWAFKTIKSAILAYNNELKAEVPNATEIEIYKKKALDLSLKYNFVTELTSLVVQQKYDLTQDELPTFNNRASSFGGQLFFSRPSRPNGRVGAPPFRRTSGFVVTPGSLFVSTTTIRYPATSTTRNPATSTTQLNYAFEPEDYSDIYEYSQENDNSTTITCSGNATLFTKTYLRGDNVTVSLDEETDLNKFKVVSLQVQGNCCWRVYSEKDFGGGSSLFSFSGGRKSNGVFNSASEMGQVFRSASSIKKAPCQS